MMSAFNCFLCSCWDQAACYISLCGLSRSSECFSPVPEFHLLVAPCYFSWDLRFSFLFVSVRLNKTITFFLLSATWALLPRSVSLPTFSSRQPHWNPPLSMWHYFQWCYQLASATKKWQNITLVGVVLASCFSQFDPVTRQIQMGSWNVDWCHILLCSCEPNNPQCVASLCVSGHKRKNKIHACGLHVFMLRRLLSAHLMGCAYYVWVSALPETLRCLQKPVWTVGIQGLCVNHRNT